MVGLLKSKYLRLFFCLLLIFVLCFSLFSFPVNAVVTEGLFLGALLAALTAGNISISGANISDAVFVREFERFISESGSDILTVVDDVVRVAQPNQIAIKAGLWLTILDFVDWIKSDIFDGSSSGSYDIYNSSGFITSSGLNLYPGRDHLFFDLGTSFSFNNGSSISCLYDGSNYVLTSSNGSYIIGSSVYSSFDLYVNAVSRLQLNVYSDGDYVSGSALQTFFDSDGNLIRESDVSSFLSSFLGASVSSSLDISSDGIVDLPLLPPDAEADAEVLLDIGGFSFSDIPEFVSGSVPSILDGSLTASIGDDVVDPPADDTDDFHSGVLGGLSSIGGFLSGIQENTSGLLSNATSFFESILEDTFGFLSDLPDYLSGFAGKFVGIWYYVVSWVSSLGSFLSLLFSVWSGLPYAMVVPVYATAVIVIVIGMWKRFFG